MVAGGVQVSSAADPQLLEAGVCQGSPAARRLEDRWILSRFNRVAQEIDEALETYRFHEAAHVVYHFFWGEYCDWYLELIKPRLAATIASRRAPPTRT